jgi:hypothetical protein
MQQYHRISHNDIAICIVINENVTMLLTIHSNTKNYCPALSVMFGIIIFYQVLSTILSTIGLQMPVGANTALDN